MERVTLEIQNPGDVDLIISFARRIGIKIIDEKTVNEPGSLKRSREIIANGCDISIFGNPVKWQKKIRKDRNLTPIKN